MKILLRGGDKMAKKKQENQFLLALGVAFVAVVLFAFNFLANTAMGSEDLAVTMKLAPATLTRTLSGEYIAVYAGVDRGKVVDSTLRLNNVGVAKTRSDEAGNLVAYFDLDMIKDSLDWKFKRLTMVLTGDLWDGGTLTAEDSVYLN